MREAQLACVRDQLVGELVVGEKAVPVFGHAPPRSEMHFVDRDRRIAMLHATARERPGALKLDDGKRVTIDAVSGHSSQRNA